MIYQFLLGSKICIFPIHILRVNEHREEKRKLQPLVNDGSCSFFVVFVDSEENKVLG